MPARLLLLGLDGATWDLLRPLADHLPNLRRLWEEGASGVLHSTTPPMTLPAWSSFLTGVNPGRHGVLDFTRRRPGTYTLEFLNATHRRVPTLLRLLSDRGGRVASLLVPGTWPPEPLDGVCVAGFDSPVATTVEAAHCRPRALYPELVRRFGGLAFADFQEGAIGPGWHEAALARMLREIGRKEALCAELLGREEWDAFMVVFGESDTAAHHFWMFHDPASPRHEPRLRGALTAVYRRLDAAVGRLARLGAVVCVASDHGFGGAGEHVLYLNRFLEAHGWLTHRDGGATGGDALRRLALRMPVERIVRRAPPALLGAVESRTRFGGVDFARTRAWSDELNYAATLHLNLRGRDPLGVIDDEGAAVADLTRLLLGWRIEGRPVVERVRTRAEAFPGPAGEGGPDLVLELARPDGYSYTLLPSVRVAPGVTWRRITAEERMGGKGLGTNGAHRPEGVLVLHGAPFRRGVTVEARLEDVLPTLFAALGEPVPAFVEGRALHEALVHLPERGRERLPVEVPVPVPSALSPAQERRLRERLERLGYLG